MATTHISKAFEAAEADWAYEVGFGEHIFQRIDRHPGDGYPHLMIIKANGDGSIDDGSVETDYGDSYELSNGPFTLGSRSLMGVLKNVHNPFRYKTFFDAWAAQNPATLSEKLLAKSIDVSERQIRNARIMGYMDGYLADKLAIKVVGIHPSNLFGTPQWLEPQSWPGEKVLEDV
jgi:hypothetical protein